MDSSEAQRVLDTSRELQITVIGRKTGLQHSTPVWFVRDGKNIFLLPVKGSKSQWYKNVVKSKQIKISSKGLSFDLPARPTRDSNKVTLVVDKFRKKHGLADVKRYYTGFNAAVELTLP